MPQLTAHELLQRRMKVVGMVLSNVPRDEIAERTGQTRRQVARDILAVSKALDEGSGTNRAALEETIAAMRAAGRLETIDNARLSALRSMATQLDTDTTNSMMFRVYWDALEAMTRDGDDDGHISRLLEELFPDPGNTQKT